MGWKKIVLWILSIAVSVFVLSAILGNLNRPKSTTFIVEVPSNTPPEDAIILHVEGDRYAMQKAGEHRYNVTIDDRPYGFEERRYGYSRGGFQVFGETHFSGNVGNRTFIAQGDARKEDVVESWKWYPTEPLPEVGIKSLAGKVAIAPRKELWVGPLLVDFWNVNFPYQYPSTINHLHSVGYEWVALAPPWDIKSSDNPSISNEDVLVPAWNDTELREEIRAFKKAGFKVFLQPQVCCTLVNATNRSDEWWNQWYDSYGAFVKYHADVAREEGVDALAISSSQFSIPGMRDAPWFAEERWDEFFEIARTSGAPVAYSYYNLPLADRNNLPWPQEASVFFDDIDFISIGIWDGLVDKDNPSQEELDRAMNRVFGQLEYAHNVSGKPIVLGQVAYFSMIGAAKQKGGEEFPTWEDPAKHLNRYDAKTQAMIYESLMREVAKRDFVQGVFPFGYWYVDAPLNLDSDIRSKPAEDVVKWWMDSYTDSLNDG